MSTDGERKLPHRDGGFRFSIGEEADGPVSAMIVIGDDSLIVTRKSIQQIRLADSVDPERENSDIPNSQQKVLSYGSDDPLVGRTFLQADELFKDHALPDSINRTEALTISLNFLKEMIALNELKGSFLAEQKEIESSFTGKLGEDSSLRIPSISNLDRRTKEFIYNADQAARNIIYLVRLFYPDINIARDWMDKLQEKIIAEKGTDHPAVKFVEWMKGKLVPIREVRNSVEHPKPDDKVRFENYALSKEGKILPPRLFYEKQNSPFPEVLISEFMDVAVDHLTLCFEGAMVHLCDIHAQPFAGDERFVNPIPEDKRPEQNLHMGYEYQIAWTK